MSKSKSKSKRADKKTPNPNRVLHGELPSNYLTIFERWYSVGEKIAAGIARCADENGLTVKDLVESRPEILKDWGIVKFSSKDVATAKVILDSVRKNIEERVAKRNKTVDDKFGVKFDDPIPPAVTGNKGDTSGVNSQPQSKRKFWNGFALTAVIRWMGAQDWTTKEASTVSEKLGFNLSPATIAAQLRAGKQGERGPAAQLNEQQEKELKNMK